MSYPTAEELKTATPMFVMTPDGLATYIETLPSGFRWYAIGEKNYFTDLQGNLILD